MSETNDVSHPDLDDSVARDGGGDPDPESEADNVAPDTDTADDGYRRAPDDFESEIDSEVPTVPDEKVLVDVEGHGEASVYIVSQEWFDDLRQDAAGREDVDPTDFGAEAVVKTLKHHYVSPSFEGLTVRKYHQSPMGYFDPFFEAIIPDHIDEGK